jgi:ABC-2 type transport system permease protein
MLRRLSFFAPAALLVVTLLSWRQYSALLDTSRQAQELSARTWESQPPRFPLQAISIPWIAPITISPLAIFEPGNGPWQGTAFYLQPGYLARAQDQLGYDYFAAGRHTELNPAQLLRILIPIFALCIAWRHKSLGQSGWIPQLREMLERLAPSFGLVFVLCAALSFSSLNNGSSLSNDAAIRFLLTLGLYLIYAVAAISLTAWGFHFFPRPAAAAAALSFFWLLNLALARPISLNVASMAKPLPRLEEFLQVLDQETRNGYLGADPREDRERRYVSETLRDYKVKTVQELPVNLSAILLQREERHQREIYSRRLLGLRNSFAAQDQIEQLLAFVFPQIAIETASAAIAATDSVSEHYQLAAADAHWDKLAEKVYSDVVQASGPEGFMNAVPPEYWRQFPRFQSYLPPVPFSLQRAYLPLCALLLWAAIALLPFPKPFRKEEEAPEA